MSRRVWLKDADWTYTVRATVRQLTVWQRAADFLGLSIPVYVATAATRYGQSLERKVTRALRRAAKQEQGE